jgi:osmotically inducible lipoprotein OsmB
MDRAVDRGFCMTKTILIKLAPLGLLMLAACGDTVGERAATGGIAGAVIAGPPGAVVGGVAGAVTDD